MITKAQLSEGLLHKTIFECLAENDQSEIIDIYIESINNWILMLKEKLQFYWSNFVNIVFGAKEP
jgi:hypothetical protein